MHYIILDLEWDSEYSAKHHRFLNHILQIGAVKLDAQLQLVDTFEVTVCSAISKRVSGRFARLTGITSEKMRGGVPFADAVRQYNAWVGEDIVTMTWSTSDLFAILENEKYLLGDLRFKLECYVDLQKYIQNELRLRGTECQSQISLAAAAELFQISTESFDLHTARDDSLVTVALLQKTYHAQRLQAMVRDTRNPEFYRRLCFKPFYINDLNDRHVDKAQLRFTCEKCGTPLRRIGKWRYRNRWFCAVFYCKSCDEQFSGRVSFRQNYEDVTVKKRVTEMPVAPEKEPEDAVQSVSAPLQQ